MPSEGEYAFGGIVAHNTYLGGNLTTTGTIQLTNLTSGLLLASANGTLSAAATSSSLFSGTQGQIAYFSGTNSLTGTSSLNIASSGKVGVGVAGGTSALSVRATGSEYQIADFQKVQSASDLGGYIGFFGGASGATSRGYVGFTKTGAGSATIFTSELADAMAIRSEGAFQVGTNGDNIALTIDTAQRVGIGTTGPTAKLTIEAGGTDATNYGQALQIVRGSTGGQQIAFIRAGQHARSLGYLPGSSTFGFGLSQSTDANFAPSQLAITDTGNVGIGTTTPAFKFSSYTSSSAVAGMFQGATAGAVGIGSTGGIAAIQGYSNDSGSAFANLALNPTSGNIGIGTTSPARLLELNSSNAALAITDSNTGGHKYVLTNQSAGDGSMGLYDNTIGLFRWLIHSSGSLGVGLTDPSARLEIASSTATGTVGTEDMLKLYRPINGGVSFPQVASFALGTRGIGGSFAPGSRLDIKLKSVADNTHTADVTVMTLQDNGNVGIGTTAPTTKLEVSGGIKTAHDAGGVLTLGRLDNTSEGAEARWSGAGSYALWTTDVYNERFRIFTSSTNSNLVEIFNAGAGSVGLIVNGSATKPGGGSWGDSSDERLKTNIASIASDDALAKIMRLRPVLFDWKNPSLHGSATSSGGFIAQEVMDVFPGFVSTATCQGADCDLLGGVSSSTYSLNLPFAFDAYLVGAVQDLNLKLEDLATTTPLETQGALEEHAPFGQRFFASLYERLAAWFADAANGIGDFFANRVRAKEEICVDDQCLTKDDVRALLEMVRGEEAAAASASGGSGGGTASAAPAPEPAPPEEVPEEVPEESDEGTAGVEETTPAEEAPTGEENDAGSTNDAGGGSVPTAEEPVPAPAPEDSPAEEAQSETPQTGV